MKLELEEIIKATSAKVLKNDIKTGKLNFSTDTRTIQKGDIFVPIKGETFDGENFIENALNNGAEAYFTRNEKVFDNAKTVLQVKDTLVAYLECARLCRKKINPKVIGITGSSGKTTAKEMMYAIASEKFRTHKTDKNHNNEIGFCQTMFNMKEDTEVLIVEMGMRGFGEIELLSKYSEPDITIITNAGTAHIGRLGSKENIAKAKCEIVKYQNPNGTFVTEENPMVKKIVDFSGKKVFCTLADVEFLEKTTDYTKFLYKGSEFEINVSGEYNVKDAIECIEAGFALGMNVEDIRNGLKKYKNIEKRFEEEIVSGFKIINDSYNANPDSMKGFVKNVVELYENPVLVLGNMGELGENSAKYHAEIGEYINTLNKTNITVLTVGELAKEINNAISVNINKKHFENTKDVSLYILANIDRRYTIFLKASRSEKFEDIIKYIKGDNL